MVVMALLPLLPLVLRVVGRAAAGGGWLNGLQYMVIEILRLVDGISQGPGIAKIPVTLYHLITCWSLSYFACWWEASGSMHTIPLLTRTGHGVR